MKLNPPNQPATGPAADRRPRHPRGRRAFSLLEVMIAIAVLFIGTFAILGLVSSSLENARRLQRPLVDASALVSQLSMTNKLVEGECSGNLGDVLGKAYSDYRYVGVIIEVQSNRLFEADYRIYNARGGNDVISRTTTLLFRPESPPGSLDGGHFGQ
ncbi:MAG: prepilin-type N-terminal cleavage/methylation domain-containing protein [Verrucomicrobiae bacterium]|nr:prepilin-type N-terminal cleavage/methylation domain-containing protein [Verrucomicrobiae bacterium]